MLQVDDLLYVFFFRRLRLHYKYVLVRGTKKDKLKWEADGLGNHRRLLVTEEPDATPKLF